MSWRIWRPSWSRRADRRAGVSAADRELAALDLGHGGATGLRVAPKAALLDRARHAGLPVPAGAVLLDGAPADAWFGSLVGRAPSSSSTVYAVRSAFSSEDGERSSRAGFYRTELNVGVDEVVDAIERVRGSGADAGRRDVLVMEMVDAVHAGVAFSEPGTFDDIVNVVDGLADDLVGGQRAGVRRTIPRLEPADPGWPSRLRHLLARLRREFGDEPWDIEWADDGVTCWLVQLRPITAPIVRDELLTLANHAEILPELPSTLMTSAIELAGPDLFEWYRRRVPGLPADRDFLYVVAGRPMINLSLLEDMMRHLGLPTAVVADSIGGGGGPERPLAPARVVRRAPSLVRLGWAQVTAVVRSGRREREVRAIGHHGADAFGQALDQLHRSYVTLVTGMFPLSSAIGPPLAVLRRAGTLSQHASTHRTVTTEMADRLRELRRSAPSARSIALERFLRDFGHRGVYESDIARPRFADEPDRWARNTADGAATADTGDTSTNRRGVRWWLTRPIWVVAARPLAARERYRHEAMRSFAAIRRSLVELAHTATENGQLPAADHLWLLDVAQARALDRGAVYDAAFVARAQRERERLGLLQPPHVVRRLDDPTDWSIDASVAEAWRGLTLAVGRVDGRCWVLREPVDSLPAGFDPATTILVARSIDAGWISTLQLVAGVAVEIGGDLSHGSILVRELGLPSITNARGVTDLTTGDRVTLDASAGTLRRTG